MTFLAQVGQFTISGRLSRKIEVSSQKKKVEEALLATKFQTQRTKISSRDDAKIIFSSSHPIISWAAASLFYHFWLATLFNPTKSPCVLWKKASADLFFLPQIWLSFLKIFLVKVLSSGIVRGIFAPSVHQCSS